MAFAPIWGTCHTTLLSMAAQRGLKGYDIMLIQKRCRQKAAHTTLVNSKCCRQGLPERRRSRAYDSRRLAKLPSPY